MAADSRERPRGKLIFSNGKFQAFNLEDGTSQTVLNDPLLWPGLSWISPGRLLVSAGGRIEVVDLNTGERREIGRGYAAKYIAETNQVLHLRPLGNPRPALFVGDFARLDGSARRIGGEEYSPRNFSPHILPGPVAIYPGVKPEAGPWRYDFRADKLERIEGLRGWIPVAWRSASRQLVCVSPERPEFILSDEWGARREPLDGLKDAIPVLYVADYDGCIANMKVNRLFSQRSTDLMWFSFKHRTLTRLREDMMLLPGTVVYAPPAG